jgi:class 3 adenylate cyclase
LGGDGYRILFKDVDDAYKFVKYFCIKVDKYNITKDNKRLFRIGAATGNVLYDESQSGIDRIIGHRVLFTVSRMVTAADPGWLYIDKATYKALPQESQKNFILRNIEGKKHERLLTPPEINGILAGFACKKAWLSAQSKRREWFVVWMTGPRLIL